MKKPKDIIDLLFMIKKRGGLYIGTKSITRLRSFIDGYMFAMNLENKEYNACIFYNFNDWMAQKYNVKKSILWDIYLLNLTNNEEKSFDLFFEDLETFLKEYNIDIPEVN